MNEWKDLLGCYNSLIDRCSCEACYKILLDFLGMPYFFCLFFFVNSFLYCTVTSQTYTKNILEYQNEEYSRNFQTLPF